MTTKERIHTDLTTALKSSDTLKAGALRYILSEIYNAEIAKGKDAVLTEEELVSVLQKQAKQRQESIEAYQKGRRADLVEKEAKELELIKSYLPEQLSEEEIRQLAEEAIEEVGVQGPMAIGKIMGILMPKIKGRADGSTVSRIVQELLRG